MCSLFVWVDDSNILYFIENFSISDLITSKGDYKTLQKGLEENSLSLIGFALYPYMRHLRISNDNYVLWLDSRPVRLGYSVVPSSKNNLILLKFLNTKDLLVLFEAEVENSLAFGFIARIYFELTPLEKIIEKALLEALTDIELEFLNLAKCFLRNIYYSEIPRSTSTSNRLFTNSDSQHRNFRGNF